MYYCEDLEDHLLMLKSVNDTPNTKDYVTTKNTRKHDGYDNREKYMKNQKKDNHKNTQISLLLSKYLVSLDRSPPIIFKSSCVDPQSFLSRQVDVSYPMISDEMQTGPNSGTKICLWLHSGHWSRKLNGGKFIAPLLVEYLIKLADKLRMMSAEASRGCRG